MPKWTAATLACANLLHHCRALQGKQPSIYFAKYGKEYLQALPMRPKELVDAKGRMKYKVRKRVQALSCGLAFCWGMQGCRLIRGKVTGMLTRKRLQARIVISCLRHKANQGRPR